MSSQAEEEHKDTRQEFVGSLSENAGNSTQRHSNRVEAADDPLYMKIISPDAQSVDNDSYPNMANI